MERGVYNFKRRISYNYSGDVSMHHRVALPSGNTVWANLDIVSKRDLDAPEGATYMMVMRQMSGLQVGDVLRYYPCNYRVLSVRDGYREDGRYITIYTSKE